MALWSYTTRPVWVSGSSDAHRQSRKVIATDSGWVYREAYVDTHGNSRVKDEVLVSIRNLANTAKGGFPDVAEVYYANTTGGNVLNTGDVNYVYLVYDEPITFANGAVAATVSLSNTAGGGDDTIVATQNNDVASVGNANNTLCFQWVANTAGTYKLEAQTIANNSAAPVSENSDGESANLVIGSAASNNAWVGTMLTDGEVTVV